MSLVIGGAHQQHQQQGLGLDRLSSKRKLDDYGSTTDDDDDDDDRNFSPSDLISVRMRKDNEPYAVNSTSSANHVITHFEPRVSSHPQFPLQFFVRMISEGTLVLHAHSNDTVKSIHERIQSVTGIPVIEQRLIYRGKQLQWEKTLGDCSVQNDAELQLVGRMRSTHHPQAWQLIDETISIICRLCKGHQGLVSLDQVKNRITEFLNMSPRNDSEKAVKHFQVFLSASVPAVLVMLYMSPYEGNKECAEEMIKLFVDSSENGLPKNVHSLCAPVVLEFCKLLGRAAADGDPLYSACRSSLGSMVECIGIGRGLNNNGKSSEEEALIVVQEIYPFVLEIAAKLSKDLELTMESPESSGPLPSDVRDFMAFLAPMRTVIKEQVGFQHSFSILGEDDYSHPCYGEESKILHAIFTDLFDKMERCLANMEEFLAMKEKGEVEPIGQRWSQCLAILKELNSISELYEDTRERFWTVLRHRKVSVCHLIVKYAKRNEDHEWLLQHKDVTDFESRRDLALMMLPEVKDEYDELHEMLIDRSQLLTESFEYIARADPETLRSGLFMEFKNEEATGPGVLREWFFLVCQAIFNPQNALFAACPNDRRRFFPNPASKVDPMHLEYFRFSGRVIALALMHKVQVGIVFDRVFFLQLAGKSVCLEDIHDADPCLYNSCKKLLEMDAEMVDSDALGLTFVQEVEELGSRKIVELCPGGRTLTVTSQNRDNYVSLLIQHRFVTSISDQVADFARGFSDILCNVRLQKLFFQSLVLEDLDWMLHGSESPISVEDWKAHTEYNGYNDTDPQIIWFWKIVEEMSAEQKKVLLFFWTSVKYLPIEGFGGLASRLHIYRSAESYNRLPSSHTCFYRLCFPPYPSTVVMEDRLRVITQEHVGCSFGTW